MFKYQESKTIELQAKFNDETITREIVAFLNSRGGVIYVGVEDDGTIVGVNKIDDSLRRLSDIVSTKIEPLPTDLIKSNILMAESKIIIEITVSKGFHCLYCVKKYGFSQSGCPVRIGTSCRELSPEDIRDRYQKRFETSRDYMLDIPARYGDISFSTLQIALANRGYHIHPHSFEDNYQLKTRDGEYNLLAEILSDQNNTHLIFVKFRGVTKASVSERSNYGRASLIASYQQLRDRLIAENICMSDTTIRPRKDTFLFDADAVNEALINALVHNDWNINEPLISMYEDRLEILSHGGLPFRQTKEKFLRGISIPRNRGLMRIFQDLEITESTGHGTLRIIEAYGPEAFEITDTYINVVIPFNKEVLQNHRLNHGDQEKESPMTAIVNEILDALQRKDDATQEELGSALGISRRTIARYMSVLKEEGIIVREGAKKNGRWVITRNLNGRRATALPRVAANKRPHSKSKRP